MSFFQQVYYFSSYSYIYCTGWGGSLLFITLPRQAEVQSLLSVISKINGIILKLSSAKPMWKSTCHTSLHTPQCNKKLSFQQSQTVDGENQTEQNALLRGDHKCTHTTGACGCNILCHMNITWTNTDSCYTKSENANLSHTHNLHNLFFCI